MDIFIHNTRQKRILGMSAPIAALAFGAAALDVAAFTRLGEVFASVMTGNLILLGLSVTRDSAALLIHTAIAFLGYILGVLASVQIMEKYQTTTTGWPTEVTLALTLEVIPLLIFAGGWLWTGGQPTDGTQLFMLGTVTLAMGVQGGAIKRLPGNVSTTYLTGTLTAVVTGLASAHPTQRAGSSLRSRLATHRYGLVALSAALLGAASGGLLIASCPTLFPIIPIAAVLGTLWLVKTHIVQ